MTRAALPPPRRRLERSRALLKLLAGACGVAAGSTLLSTTLSITPEPAFASVGADGAAAAAVPPPLDYSAVASYDLSARLDAATHAVDAQGTIRWVNSSSRAATELWLHLYLNAFSHDRTLFLRSSGGRQQGRLKQFGDISVKRLVARELGSVDLWPGAATHSPGDPDDTTDIRVPLPRPVQPGEHLTLDCAFEAHLPQLFERTGFVDSFHFVAQWFPKLARREPDGTWAHFAFHPQAEFYADFGDYDVTLDVPADMIVGATGQRVQDHVDGGRKVVRYVARGVHDFAWTAWDGFIERRERIANVDVRVLYPRGNDANTEHSLAALRYALPELNRRYGRYPYPTLTVVHPPCAARAAGGMEYPTLITTGAPWFAPLVSRAIETVTVHELGHQWFYGLVATNERAAPVLDEGLDTWAESVTMRRRYGASSALSLPGLDVSAEALRRALCAEHEQDDVVVQPAPDFDDFASIGALVYAKTATTLATLANVYGEDRVEQALGHFARQGRFRHPSWKDFVHSFERYVGSEATRQLRLALEDRGFVNYVAEAPRCRPFQPDEEPGQRIWRCTARVKRQGTLELPVDIAVISEDGTRASATWNGRGASHIIHHQGPQRVTGVVVDPAGRIPLDTDLLDNAASSEKASSRRVLEQATFAVQAVLGWVGP